LKDVSTLVSSNTGVLTTQDCWRLLDDSPVGRLAVVRGSEPDIFPVNYVVDHGGIFSAPPPGRSSPRHATASWRSRRTGSPRGTAARGASS
jgi:hypothetical protein